MKDDILYYCNFPTEIGNGEEGSISSKYKLTKVFTIIRHGDRFPIHSIPNHKYLTESCKAQDNVQLKKKLPSFKNYTESMNKQVKLNLRNKGDSFKPFPIFPNDEFCGQAFLTPEGAAQHVEIGKLLNERYIKNHKLLDDQYDNKVYAGNNSLCHQKSNHPCACKPLKEEAIMNLMASGVNQPANSYKHPKLYSVYKHMSNVFDVDASNLPPARQIMDTAMVQACHNEFLPSYKRDCINPVEFRKLVNFVNSHGKTKVNTNFWKVVSYLKMIPLLYEIASNMKEKTIEKFFLYSGHDSTIDPLLTLLGVNTGIWPPYASRIIFEQYEYNERNYFRVLYNGKDVTRKIGFCKGKPLENDKLCSLETLWQFVNFQYLKELKCKSYRAACSIFSFKDNSLFRNFT
ncbi:DgyrCDS4933 [Dimorphilus gyrociliatus]|uniref:2-phosphoxylose phosphatase 1 n=1 Tax=Dimorphilus gyrociliatus TaxID=2664684 RepID=A0A7I8VJW7_9ANNE|nr:DgyrCDS4933 [Dimorphilus gyrociliatus]